MNPDNPRYSIAESNLTPEFPPDHLFVPPELGVRSPCWKGLFQLDSGHWVRCGVAEHLHPPRTPHLAVPVEDGP